MKKERRELKKERVCMYVCNVGDGPCPAKTIRNMPEKKSKYWVVDRSVDDYNGVQDEWIEWQNKQRCYVPCFR